MLLGETGKHRSQYLGFYNCTVNWPESCKCCLCKRSMWEQTGKLW